MSGYVLRTALTLGVIVGTLNLASAQYGGGGGMPGTSTSGSPTYSNRSYSSKGAVIGGVAGGAAALGGFLYWRHHNRAKLVGCVTGNGDKLVSDKKSETYSLSNPEGENLKTGERLELSGKKTKGDSGEHVFEVRKMSKDLGKCTATTAQNR